MFPGLFLQRVGSSPGKTAWEGAWEAVPAQKAQ